MTTKNDLIDYLENPWINEPFPVMAKKLSNDSQAVSMLWEIIHENDHKIAWRAAYMLDQINDLDKTRLNDYIEPIANELPSLTDESLKRHFLRILTRHSVEKIDNGALVEACFNWLQSEMTAIAVKAHCMEILYRYTTLYPDLKQELRLVLEDLLPYGSKGEVSRAKKILKLL